MIRRLLVLMALAALGGCAQQNGPHPSYIGLSDVSSDDDADTAEPSKEPSANLSRVQSNKVLGAMAFEKVTGRPVDPDSLSGRE